MQTARSPCLAVWPSLTLLMSLVSACGGGSTPVIEPPPPPPPQATFIHEGLEKLTVRRIRQHGDRLFAGTDAGLFSKPIGQDSWQTLGLDDSNIRDIGIIDNEHWLVAVSDTGTVPNVNPRLLETVNGGSNWLEVDNDFGGPAPEGMHALHYDSDNQRLYATGADALAVSDDVGRSWRLIDGIWDDLSPPLEALGLNDPRDQVWVGGQNAIGEMVLRRFDLETGESTSFVRILPSPATIKGVTFDPGDPDRILASGEGGILQSLDNGDSWTNLLGDVDSRFYFQAVLDPEDSQVIYTAG